MTDVLIELVSAITFVTAVPPVPGLVVQRFVAPACQRCAGHRGVTIDNPDGIEAVSPVAGVVTFAGSVARQLYVVIQRKKGELVTVGHLESISATKGDVIKQGQVLGVAGATTYLGVRARGQYVEPLRWLGFGGARLVGGEAVVGLRAVRR